MKSIKASIAATAAIGVFLTGCGSGGSDSGGSGKSTWHIVEKPDEIHDFALIRDGKQYPFDLLDPELAPDEIKQQVMLGFNICEHTQQYAPGYAGDSLTCSNCHFNAGNSLGGINGGISLVGVTTRYPRYSPREKKTIDLRQRINSCFEKSLNGHPLPVDGELMNGLITYLEWISSEVNHIPDIPWLGLKPLQALEQHQGSAAKGKAVYLRHCAGCHQDDGSGTEGIPAVFGSHSYNDGAGMHELGTLAAFIHANMPEDRPVLSQEQAIDAAAYLISMPRPHYEVSDDEL